MPEATFLQPWWIRWAAWWKNQCFYLRAMDPQGSFHHDARAHRIEWRGALPAAGRPWELSIQWGPGTPFTPPSLYPVGHWSAYHQLRDGSMCLSPPRRLEKGYCGVEDIGFWLGQAVKWFEGYATEDWAVSELEWALTAPLLPGPGYRVNWRPSLIIGLPPAFRTGPPGRFGLLRAAIPENRIGLGLVTHWASGDGRLHASGLSPEELLEEPYIRYDGVWLCPDESLDEQRLSGDLALFRDRAVDREFRKLVRHMERIAGRKDRPLLEAIGCDAAWGDASRIWSFSPRDHASNALARQAIQQPVPDFYGFVQHMAESFKNRLTFWSGTVLGGRALDARRRAGRPDELHRKLLNSNIMLVGLGSLGSEVAHVLAQEGVEQFFLADGDVLFPGNVTRHRAPLSEVGLSKGDAVAKHLRRINPQVSVHVQNKWFEELIPELQLLSRSRKTVVVGLTGDEGSEYALSEFCTRLGLPCLHAWIELDGRVLRLFRAVKQGDPTLLELANEPSRLPLISQPTGSLSAEARPPEQCAEVILPGSASDIHASANFVARSVLDVLMERDGTHNHWLFSPGGIDEPEWTVPDALRVRYGVAAYALSRSLEPKQLTG